MKRLATVTILFVLICASVLASSPLQVRASTVTGIIASDTTWTRADSPVDLTGKVLVKDGVTLTIEAGVTVNLHSYSILVNGTLNAQGIDSDRISINGLSGNPPVAEFIIAYTYGILFNDNNPALGSNLQNVDFNQATVALGPSDIIDGCTSNSWLSSAGTISNCTSTSLVGADGGKVSGCHIYGGIHFKWGSPVISNNFF